MRFTAIILCILSLSLGIASAQQHAGQAAAGQSLGAAPQARQDDIQELRSDLERMKVLVQQMESNLAFVDTTQSPLKRQFQLEIDMWKTVIQQMERRLEKAGPHSAHPARLEFVDVTTEARGINVKNCIA